MVIDKRVNVWKLEIYGQGVGRVVNKLFLAKKGSFFDIIDDLKEEYGSEEEFRPRLHGVTFMGNVLVSEFESLVKDLKAVKK